MLTSTLLFLFSAASSALAVKQGVPTAQYNDFVHFLAISQAAYASNCPNPGGLTKLVDISIAGPDIHGFILRDDKRKQIVTAFRGTASQTNLDEDQDWTLANFSTLPSCSGCQVHGGYYGAWTKVVDTVKSQMTTQSNKYPDYGMVITGHSLGAGMATLASAQFSTTFKNLTTYTYGEPRMGNPAFASFINSAFSATSPDTTRFFRVTHMNDGIVTAPPAANGYMHHGIEFWSKDPASASNMFVCGGETTTCCAGQGGSGINAAHVTYFGIGSGNCVNK